ncbi:MAG: TonB-dependent receptor [Bacteroidota bacterium]
MYRKIKLLFFLFFISFTAANAQTGNLVTGRVTDNVTNEAISDASVSVKGKKTGTVTDAAGNFKIKAVTGDVLIITILGYRTENVTVNSSKMIAVSVTPTSSELNNVVVIGYGERKRKDVLGSVAVINSKDIQKTTALSPEIALKGQVAGVRVSSGGDPTSRPTVRIRGTSTFGYQDPLYVIDGIPIVEAAAGNWKGSSDPGNNGTFRTPVNLYTIINAEDIESMSVLKDATATAIYGVRAANGVILITTKKGKKGRAKIDVDGYQISNQNPKTWKVLNTQQYIKIVTDAYNANPAISGGLPQAIGANSSYGKWFDPSNPAYLGNSPTYDWQDAVINKSSKIQQMNVRVSGGSDNTLYNLSANYMDADGSFIAKNSNRYSISSNVQSKLTKFLEVGLNLRLVQESILDNTSNLGVWNYRPWQQIYGSGYGGYAPSGRVIGGGPVTPTSTFAIDNYGPNTKGNPLGSAAASSTRYKNEGILGTAYVQLEPITGLKIKGTYNAQRYTNVNAGWSGFDAWQFSPTPSNPYGQVAVPIAGTTPGYNAVGTAITLNEVKQLSVDYLHSFKDHNLALTLVAEQTEISGRSYAIGYTVNTYDPALRYVDGTQSRPVNFNTLGNYGLISYIGRLSYNFANRFYAEGSVNRNGSSRFAPEHQWGTFPAGALGWRISQEKFMQSLTFVNDFKIRGGYGVIGNEQTTGGWDYLSNPNPNPHYSLGNNSLTGAGPIQPGVAYTTYPNFDLTWEKKKTTNIGFEGSFLNNSLNITFDYYRNVTDGIIQGVGLAPSVGYEASTNINVASVLNRGIEVQLGYNKTIGKVQFSASANFSTVHNEVISLFQNQANRGGGQEVGRSLGFIYGYKVGGIFQNQGEIDKWKLTNTDKIGKNTQQPGDAYFLDLYGPAIAGTTNKNPTKDGVINDQDQDYIGKSIPGYTYGFTLSANYMNFDASAFFLGVGDVQKSINGGLYDMSGTNNMGVQVLNYWTPTNTNTDIPRAVRADPNSNNRFSNRFVRNADFLRLQNLSVGYNFPKKILAHTKSFQNLRLYVTMLNVFTITKWPGLDPENDNTPIPRQLQFGFRASF